MSGSQLEDGFFRIAQELREAECRIQMSGHEWRVYLFIQRKTFGWNKKRDQISLTQFEDGIGLERRRVAESIKRLSDRNMIVIEKQGGGKTNIYSVQTNVNKWEVVRKNALGSSSAENRRQVVRKTGKGSAENRRQVVRKTAHTKDTNKRHYTKDNITKEKPRAHTLKTKKLTTAPRDFPVTQEMIIYAASKRVNVQKAVIDETEGFLIYHRAKGSKFVDWYSAWQNWIRNYIKFNKITDEPEGGRPHVPAFPSQ